MFILFSPVIISIRFQIEMTCPFNTFTFRHWLLYLLMYVFILLRWIVCRMINVRWSELSALLGSIGSNLFSFVDAGIGSMERARFRTAKRWMRMDATPPVIIGNDWCPWLSTLSFSFYVIFFDRVGIYISNLGTTLMVTSVREFTFSILNIITVPL